MKLLTIPEVFFVICIIPTMYSCDRQKDQTSNRNLSLRISEARFQPITLDSSSDLMVIPVNSNGLRKFRGGKPLQSLVAKNISWASSTSSLAVKPPKIIIPGKNGFAFPQIIPVSGRPIPARMPETFVAKEMEIKTPNPAAFSAWGKLHGLKSETVTALLQDKIGNVWICTSRGVTKYDGKSFSNFTTDQGLAHNDVRSLLEDSKGNLWFGTNGGGVSKYDGYSFTNFTTGDGLINNYVATGMVEDLVGNIWMATWEGVSKFDGRNFTNFREKNGLVNKTVEAILKDKNGNIWIGTQEGLSIYDGISFSNYTMAEGLTSHAVMSILEDTKGKIWLGTKDGGIIKFNGSSFELLTTRNNFPLTQVNSLIEDTEGHIWVGTRDGLSEYDGKKFKNYSESQGLTNDNIYCLLEDNSGNIWVGTGSGGIMRHNPRSFSHITQSEGLKKNYVSSLYEDKQGNLWIGAWRGGVSVYDGSNLRHITGDHGLFQDEVNNIFEDRVGNFWFSVYKGVARYDGTTFTYISDDDGLVNEDVNAIMQDSIGNMWFGTNDGITKYNGEYFTNLFHHGKEAKKIYAISEDRHSNIWFCTSAGIIKYNGNVFEKLVTSDQQPDASIYCMFEDEEGIFWFGSERGILKYDGKQLASFGKTEGLINNEVMSIARDNYGNLWFGTRFGLSKLSRPQSALLNRRIKSGEITEEDVFFSNYTHTEGFLGVGSNLNTMIRSANGLLYIGTNNGISFFDPAQKESGAAVFNLQVTGIRMFDQLIEWSALQRNPDSSLLLNNEVRFQQYSFDTLSRWYNLPNNLSLSFNNNSVGFDFVATATEQPQNIKYRYQLVGFDETYSSLTTQSRVSYGNLSPGVYIFKVKAMNHRGDWSNEYVLPFSIRPPWWQTFGFRAFALIAFSTIIYFLSRAINRYQLRKTQRLLENEILLQNERQRISSDLHDEIGSTLSSISIYAGLAKKESNNDVYLESISTNVSEVVGKLDELVWRINPKYDTFGSVIYRIMAYAEPLAASRKIVFSLQEDEDSKRLKLSTDTKHHLYMILKELLNNAFKHSACTSISIKVFRTSEYMELTVTDNGIGFDFQAANNNRNGLQNIRHRIGLINGKLSLDSSDNGGSNVCVRIPIV